MKIERIVEAINGALLGKSKHARRPHVDVLDKEIKDLRAQLNWEREKNAMLHRELAAERNSRQSHLLSTIESQREYIARQNNIIFCKCGLSHTFVKHPGACL